MVRNKEILLEKKKSVSFMLEGLDQSLISLLKNKAEVGILSEHIRKALSFYDWFINFNVGFKRNLIEENYEEMKFLLRQIGNKNKKEFEKSNNR